MFESRKTMHAVANRLHYVSFFQEVTLTFWEGKISVKNTFKRLLMTFQKDALKVLQDEDESKTSVLSGNAERHNSYLTTWTEGRFAVGGLLGEITEHIK